MDRSALVHRRPADRLPQVMVRGYWLRGWKISPDLGGIPRGWQEAKSKQPTDWPDAGSHVWRRARFRLPVSVVLGRQGGRGGWQDGCPEQPRNSRVSKVHGGLLEGRSR